jgi:ABC-2 type transport system ATP-binding protein
MSYIEEFCDAIAILNGGTVALQGDLRQIKRDYPRDRLVVASPDADRICGDFPGRCTRRQDGTLLLTLSDPDQKRAVMGQLAQRYDVDELRVFEPSLNDIFVEYAGGQV